MVVAQKTKEAEITEQDSLLLTRNLLRIAIYNISYIRGLFHEKYFSDKSVPALEMKIKKLMPMDAESRRLIDWMEKGVYDALQKKYLKTLLFCICEKEEGPMIEEYAFSFSYPNTSTEEVAMNMSRTGSKKGSTTFTSNASEVTPDQMRSSACKMIRTLVSLMRTLDPMPEERTILMKLLYYDDVTPEDYEPPFFKGCADNEAINIWSKNPMEVGNVNSKHLVLALKVKSVLDPCDDNNVNSGDDGMSVDNESDQDDDFSDTEVRPSEADRYVVAPNDGKCKGQSTGTISEDDTQDAAHEEELTAQVKEWICSRETGTINVSDVLSNFPDISMEMVEDIMERLLKDGVLSRASKDGYTINQIVDPKISHIKKEIIMQNVSPTEGTKQNNGDLMYMKALYHALPMDYVTIAKLQGKLDGEATQNTVRKLIDDFITKNMMKIARSSACKMTRRVISLMRTMDPIPEEVKNALQSFDDNYVTKIDDSLSVDDKSDYDCFSHIEIPKKRYGYLLVSSSKKIEFILDSGATHHICNDEGIMRNLKAVKEEDQVPLHSCDGVELKAEMIGSVVTKNFKLSQVGFLPKMPFNVVSISQLANQGLLTNISDGHFSITSVNDARLVCEGFLQTRKEKPTGRIYHEYVFRTMIWDVPGDDKKLIDAGHENESTDNVKEWVIDTGCASHMVPELSMLSNPRSEKISFQGAAGKISSSHKGYVKEGKLFLKDVRYSPDVMNKLISVAMLDLSGHRITFNAERCTIVHKDGLELKGIGLLENITGLYWLNADGEKNMPAVNAEAASKDELLDNEDRKNKNKTALEDDDVTMEVEDCGLPPDGKDVKNKRAATQAEGKAAKRTKKRKLK